MLAVTTCSSTMEGREPQALGAPSSPSVRSETAQGSIPDPSQPRPTDTYLWYICPVSRADGALGVCGEVYVPSLMRVRDDVEGVPALLLGNHQPDCVWAPLSWALWSVCSRPPRSQGDMDPKGHHCATTFEGTEVLRVFILEMGLSGHHTQT